METNIRFWSYLAHFFLEWEMFQTKVVEKIKTHVSYSVRSFEYRAVYDVTYENIVERGRPQIAVWLMCITC